MRKVACLVLVLIGGCTDTSVLTTEPDMRAAPDLPQFPMGCSSGALDGQETDVDCGGPECMPCSAGRICKLGRDCQSTFCTNNVCDAPSCGDKVKNGTETDVDCGGGCEGCGDGQNCNGPSDCKSATCTNGKCAPGPCSDGVKDGFETDVDCGGGTCPACDDGKSCAAGTDCKSGTCTNGVCKSPVVCMPGTANCDGNAANGCEVNTNTDPKNCGKCGNLCPGGRQCVNGTCSTEPASCRTVDGIRWCYNPDKCGEACGAVCMALGMGLNLDPNTWWLSQNTQQKCQKINDAFGLGGMAELLENSPLACIEGSRGNNIAPGPPVGPLICSNLPSCPANIQFKMDDLGVPCGPNSRRTVCPCTL